MFRIQTNMTACEKKPMSYSVLGTVLVCKPANLSIWRQKRYYRLKNPVYILSWKYSKHIMDHLWNQTDHNLDQKSPDYGQPVTINMCDQTITSLESCSIYYDRV